MRTVYAFLFSMVVFLFLVSCSPAEKQETFIPDYSVAIDSARARIQRVQLDSQVPGMAITVSVDGNVVWSEGLGYSDLENRTEVDPSKTLFRIGSVSKPMTATAMALLYQEGLLDLDAEIQKYYPDFPEKKYPITVRSVAGHTAGIRHYRGREMYSDVFYPDVESGINIFKDDSLLFEPNTQYSYSSYGWNLLSKVVENISGQPFLEYMNKEVFQALELNNTMADVASDSIPNRTKFYEPDNGVIVEAPYVDNSYKWAGGGFISTSEDLVTFGNSYLAYTIVDSLTVADFTEPQVIRDTVSTNYGVGWAKREDPNGVIWFGHSGGSVGGITRLVIYPNEGIVIGIVSNSGRVDYDGAEFDIAQYFREAMSDTLQSH